MAECRIDVNSAFVIENDRDEMQLTCSGSYDHAPQRQLIVYDEYTGESCAHVTVTVEGDRVDIDRSNLMSLHLTKGVKVTDEYKTEFGMMLVEYTATKITNHLTPNGGKLLLHYEMSIGGVATKNEVTIVVTPDK